MHRCYHVKVLGIESANIFAHPLVSGVLQPMVLVAIDASCKEECRSLSTLEVRSPDNNVDCGFRTPPRESTCPTWPTFSRQTAWGLPSQCLLEMCSRTTPP